MDRAENAVEENRRLRRTMRDLVALSTLPADLDWPWPGRDRPQLGRRAAEHPVARTGLRAPVERHRPRAGVEVFRSKHRTRDTISGHEAVQGSARSTRLTRIANERPPRSRSVRRRDAARRRDAFRRRRRPRRSDHLLPKRRLSDRAGPSAARRGRQSDGRRRSSDGEPRIRCMSSRSGCRSRSAASAMR